MESLLFKSEFDISALAHKYLICGQMRSFIPTFIINHQEENAMKNYFQRMSLIVLIFLLNVIRNISHGEYRTGMCCSDM